MKLIKKNLLSLSFGFSMLFVIFVNPASQAGVPKFMSQAGIPKFIKCPACIKVVHLVMHGLKENKSTVESGLVNQECPKFKEYLKLDDCAILVHNIVDQLLSANVSAKSVCKHEHMC